jgi:hydrogenase maturation protein HypF
VTLPAPRRAGASLALGAHLKSTVAIRIDRDVFVSQHLGDLETEAAFAAFKEGIGALRQLYPQAPREVLCDLHPDYLSSRHAATLGVPVIRVQHHAAHVAACMAENDLEGPVLGIAWDGTGYGTDGSVWGGEFFRASRAEFARIGHLRAFRLPGGEQAIREPRRAALGLLFAARGADALHDTSLAPVRDFTQGERDVFAMMLSKGVGSPMTSSAGRLFDAVASLLGVRQVNTFEGQAAMELEDRAGTASGDHAYPFDIEEISGKLVFDWRPLLESILMDSKQGRRDNEISLFFHNTMANVIVSMARRTGLRDIVLSGGCFQNALLAESALCRLRAAGFRPHRHRAIPPNDGGISYGQAVWAAWGTGLRT